MKSPSNHRKARFGLLVAGLLVAGLSGCERQTDAPRPEAEQAVAEAPPEEAEPTSPSDEAGPLEAAVGLTFGLPLPVGLDLLERDEDVARFASPHPVDALLSFYDDELSGHERSDGSDGTKYEPSSGDGTTVFIVLGQADDEPAEIIYVQGPVDLSGLELDGGEPDEAAQARVPEPSPWGPSLRLPPQAYSRLEAERDYLAAGRGGGRHYQERYEEIDGERVRVLVLRGQADDSLLDLPPNPRDAWPEHWNRLPRHRSGAFDRGEGHLSLRPVPERDAEGNALPFLGSQGGDLEAIGAH